METETKRTPTPIKVHYKTFDGRTDVFLTDRDDRLLANLNGDTHADFIVRACNAYEELVAACEAVAENWDTPANSKGGCVYCGGNPCDCFLGLARAAIKKARGEA